MGASAEQPEIDAAAVRRLGESLGFGLVGFTPAQPSDYREEFRRWLADGKHGEMEYLNRNVETRLDPCELVDGAQSIIVVADFYDAPRPEPANPKPTVAVGRIARYARGDDYHKVMKKRLHTLADALRENHAGEAFRVAVDTAPVLEREHAARAGLGWTGKHTLLIHPRKGSWMLLGVIVTTLRLHGDGQSALPTSYCGTCTRCIDACPTDCITPYSIDASRCISYLTLEHRGPIPPELHAPIGGWIAGCDVCQEVCPFNQQPGPKATNAVKPNPAYGPRPGFDPGPRLLDLLGWSAEDRQQAFIKSALKRVKLDMLKRNALIAAGNYLLSHEDALLRKRIEELAEAQDEVELVRITAKQVLAFRLQSPAVEQHRPPSGQ